MAVEIERKFLPAGEGWRGLAEGKNYRQGYLCSDNKRTVRVRIAGKKGYLTVKGKTVGMARSEYEYEIALSDAEEMLKNLCEKPLIEKTRYRIPFKGHIWEVDEFSGENEGLVVAEVELAREDEEFVKPEWIAMDVTGDPRYYNANLIKRPFCRWER
jgi:CYTH domain-containing protein